MSNTIKIGNTLEERIRLLDGLSIELYKQAKEEMAIQIEYAGRLKKFVKNAFLMYSISDASGKVLAEDITVSMALDTVREEYPHIENFDDLFMTVKTVKYWR